MKTPWAQALAWIAAVALAILFALAGPDEAAIERHSFPLFDGQALPGAR